MDKAQHCILTVKNIWVNGKEMYTMELAFIDGAMANGEKVNGRWVKEFDG